MLLRQSCRADPAGLLLSQEWWNGNGLRLVVSGERKEAVRSGSVVGRSDGSCSAEGLRTVRYEPSVAEWSPGRSDRQDEMEV